MGYTIVHVAAVIDLTDCDTGQWIASAASAPFVGLFAFGDSFNAARDAFAEVVAAAVANQPWPPGEVTAIRVLATTRKTYPIDQLATT